MSLIRGGRTTVKLRDCTALDILTRPNEDIQLDASEVWDEIEKESKWPEAERAAEAVAMSLEAGYSAIFQGLWKEYKAERDPKVGEELLRVLSEHNEVIARDVAQYPEMGELGTTIIQRNEGLARLVRELLS
jgi:hypothetical protein